MIKFYNNVFLYDSKNCTQNYKNDYFLLIVSLHIAILKYNLFANGIEHIDAYASGLSRIKFVILQFIYIFLHLEFAIRNAYS